MTNLITSKYTLKIKEIKTGSIVDARVFDNYNQANEFVRKHPCGEDVRYEFTRIDYCGEEEVSEVDGITIEISEGN